MPIPPASLSLYLEMRGKCIALAADLDRLQRSTSVTAADDPQLQALHLALAELSKPQPGRAGRIQMIFSDTTPPPVYDKK